MPDSKKSTLHYIMHYGAWLGLFWMVKYLFQIGETYWKHFIYFYYVLNIVSPLLMYFFYLNYLKINPQIKHTLLRCIVFLVGISLCASFFEDALIFARFTYLDTDTLYNMQMNMQQYMENYPFSKFYNEEQMASVERMYGFFLQPKILLLIYLAANTFVQMISSLIFAVLIGLLTNRGVRK